MLPILFEIGPIKVYSFGLMMGIAFIVANYFFVREMRRRGMSEQMAGTITLIALVAGVVGSKLFSVLENWDRFVLDPVGEFFSAAGLTFYGGLIMATLSIWLYVRSKKIPFLRIADAASPSLILAYGIGRIGCHLSGDGDYGLPSDVPWAMGYPKGTVSTLAEKNPDLAALYAQIFPGRAVPADIPVHPTPLYEFLATLVIFAILWSFRKKPRAMGSIFALYLIFAGLERLLVEFIRLNPLYLGLSQAQWISVGMIILGSAMLFWLRNQPADTIPVTPPPGTARRTTAAARA